jgi:enoyl-CoA hydratase/carnithine racemase
VKKMGNDLLYEVKDLVAYMTINRESKRTAISQEMITAFMDGLERAGAGGQWIIWSQKLCPTPKENGPV